MAQRRELGFFGTLAVMAAVQALALALAVTAMGGWL